MEDLESLANVASIATGLLVACFWAGYAYDARVRRVRLENYLRAEKAANPDKPKRSTVHLMAKVGLTQDEILQASFHSNRIKRYVHVNPNTNLADELLFEYQA